ncbi:hypothetical protein OWV82_017097 [Melia azedarach]|uniref:Uncharacterized protein n=1 Tax=Melia azedarach TaxID=155640 RepID=A0ACC1XJB7_MELAZ|nr:hypothetical protein OWV82_017097 [Melia azedarach]
MHGSPNHQHKKHHHAKHYKSWDTSDGFPVYVTALEPMQNRFPEGQHYPYGYYGSPMLNNNYQEYVLEEPRRTPVIEYGPPRVPVHVKANHHKVEENVDEEAEEFIKMEHKKFQLSKLRSELSG